mmetsp:Transcript_11735/g.21087  ORF Transcript_11735/g.21087 Transcript_11735/m.21087 type:complete len:85 (+) Transcript_11735:220-474(+)
MPTKRIYIFIFFALAFAPPSSLPFLFFPSASSLHLSSPFFSLLLLLPFSPSHKNTLLHFSSKTATPGKTLPSNNSNAALPPVLT